MDGTGLAATAVLVVLFAVSGVAKLADLQGTRAAVEAFGVPGPATRTLAVLLPLAELGVALALLPGASRAVGGGAAALLLVVLSAAVLVNLVQGRRPTCHCFGRWGTSDVSWRTVLRNALLLVVAGAVAVDPRWTVGTGPAVLAVAAGAALAVGVLAVEHAAGAADVAARSADEQERTAASVADGLTDRGPAPDVSLLDLDGRPRRLAELEQGAPVTLLVVLSPGCGPCRELAPSVTRWASTYAGRLGVVVVSYGDVTNLKERFSSDALVVLRDDDRVLRDALGTQAAPSAVLLSGGGRLLSEVGGGSPSVRVLLAAGLTGAPPDLENGPDMSGAPADSLTLDSVVALRPTVTRQDLDDESVLVDEATGANAVLDRVGTVVVQCLDGADPLREVVTDLADAFGAPVEVVGADVLAMVRRLGAAGLLLGIAPDPEDDSTVTDSDAQALA